MDIFTILALVSFATLIVSWMVLPHSSPATVQTTAPVLNEAQPVNS